MTPKQKADELFKDFLDLMDIQYPPNAKYMAIRCVQEVDRFLQKASLEDPYGNLFELEYWQDVKRELEKL